MNIVLVLIDSLNRDCLSAYNNDSQIDTPNLDRFAQTAQQFDNHFVGSLPCMPARREIFAGQKEMMWRPWGPLEPVDKRLPKLLEDQDYSTALITDHYHYWEDEANGYVQSFQGTQLIRGQELDFWQQPIPITESLPRWVENIERWRPGKGRRYYSNVKNFKSEEDFFPSKVFTNAVNWLSENAKNPAPFFLQVESFDVHEPFHIPEPYASMYSNGARENEFTIWPPYQDAVELKDFMESTSQEELQFIRSQYAGKLTMVDRWFGELLRKLDELSLWQDTMVIVTTDHGHDLGERGKFGKQYPHFDSHANIPLFVWHPSYVEQDRSVTALTQTVDLFSTILEAAGATPQDQAHGRSLLSHLAEDGVGSRDALLYGTFGQGICCTDGEWTLFKSPEHDGPLYYYSPMVYKSISDTLVDSVASPSSHGQFIPGIDIEQWQVPVEIDPRSIQSLGDTDLLYHRSDDRRQEENLWKTESKQRNRMLELTRELMIREGAPAEQYTRLGLPSA